jgi:hypothetical protein
MTRIPRTRLASITDADILPDETDPLALRRARLQNRG